MASGDWGQSRHKRVDRGRSLVAGGAGYGRAGGGLPERRPRAYLEVRVAQARLPQGGSAQEAALTAEVEQSNLILPNLSSAEDRTINGSAVERTVVYDPISRIEHDDTQLLII